MTTGKWFIVIGAVLICLTIKRALDQRRRQEREKQRRRDKEE